MSHVCDMYRRFFVLAMLAGVLTTLLSSTEVRAQGMQPMPGMGDAKTGMASATGTVTAINAADRKITVNHGPIP
jgi:Cu(I)/Ag(I) efflux system protein CusF